MKVPDDDYFGDDPTILDRWIDPVIGHYFTPRPVPLTRWQRIRAWVAHWIIEGQAR